MLRTRLAILESVGKGLLVCAALLSMNLTIALAQVQPKLVAPPGGAGNAPEGQALPAVQNLVRDEPFVETTLQLDPSRSRLLRTAKPVFRMAITQPDVVDVNQFSPTELELIGKRSGETTVTLWLGEQPGEHQIVRYVVRVESDRGEERRAQIEYARLQRQLNELFPNSQVQLFPVLDKLIVRGQARDAKEATQIMAVIRGQAGNPFPADGSSGIRQGAVAAVPGATQMPPFNAVNLLEVPGEHQVMLKVRVAELTRTALRELGMDFEVLKNNFSVAHFIGGAGNLTAILDSRDVGLFIRAFSSHGYGKILAEPTLVTLSGHPATFLAGGEFAVPTVVGVDGVSAATTQFRGFGTQLSFVPTVLDKDRIRLQVQPSFSTLNQANAVQGVPGLDTRAVSTTVDLREGQWLAIAGLIQDQQNGSRGELPGLGALPGVGALFGTQNVRREESELVVLVSPELVHPLEREQVPLLLPGVDVTDPTDAEFYLRQRIEGDPECDHRSTVWPAYRNRIRDAMRAQKKESKFLRHEEKYLFGPCGFSE